MSGNEMTPFADLIAETRDGEWGEGDETSGHTLCEVVRGTDFAHVNEADIQLPRRWISDHLVERKALHAGDILIETAGGTAKQSTGRTAILTAGFFERHKELPVLCSSFARHLRVDSAKVRSDYLYYVLQALYRAGYMAVYNLQHTGIARFQFTAFKNKTSLCLATPSEQKRIAAILTAYDELIANNQRRIALLETMAEEIYREWFVRMRFPDSTTVPVEHGVPDGWALVQTAQAFKFHGGATPSKEVPRFWSGGTIHWYTPTDITGSEGVFLESSAEMCSEEGLESCSATLFPAYTVMMTSRATIGAIGINLTPACTNQGFIACIPNKTYPLSYLYHWLKLAKPHFESLSGGSTFAELTKGTFKRIRILTPPETIVEAFDGLVAPMFKEMEALIKANSRLKTLSATLLPRLISGKLKVDQLDICLPPSMQAEATA